MRQMRKAPLTPEKQGSEEIPQSQNAENAENAENADTKTRKMRTRKRGKCGKCGWLALMWLALGDPYFRGLRSKALVFVDRMPIRHFRRFLHQNPLFSVGGKDPVWQKNVGVLQTNRQNNPKISNICCRNLALFGRISDSFQFCREGECP